MAVTAALKQVLMQTTDTTATTYSWSDGPSTPSLIICMGMAGQANSSDSGPTCLTSAFCLGAASAATRRGCAAMFDANANASSALSVITRNDCLAVRLNSGASNAQLDVQSFDANGATLICDVVPSANTRFHLLVIYGLTDAEVATFQEHTAVASQTHTVFTDLGTPDALILFSAGNGTINTVGAAGHLMMGMAGGVTTADQGVALIESTTALSAAQDSQRYGLSGQIVALGPNTTALTTDARAVLTAFTAEGFTLNWTARAATRHIVAVGIRSGGSVKWFEQLTQTNTNAFGPTITGHTPKALILGTVMTAEATSPTPVTHAGMSVGLVAGTASRVALGFMDTDALATSNVTDQVSFDQGLVFLNSNGVSGGSTAATLRAELGITTMASESLQFTMASADSAAEWFMGLSIGDVYSASKPRRALLGVGA